ncbi:MAG: iron-sulfur cluster assembly scaffold protein, partial [Methanosarcina thermophila]
TEMIKGKTLEEAWNLTNEEVAEALEGLPPGKLECSVVSREAIHRAINDYRKKQGLETLPEQD